MDRSPYISFAEPSSETTDTGSTSEPSSETTDTGGTSEPSSETTDTSTPEDTSIPEDTSPEEPTSEPSEPATDSSDSSDTSVDTAFVFESAAQKAEEKGGFGCSTIQFGGIALFWLSALLVSFRREG